MNQKVVIGFLGLISLVLIGITAFTLLKQDRTGPVIKLEHNVAAYREGEDTSHLLDGITAVDEEDGDVSDSLIVVTVTPSTDGATAWVVIAAKDKSDNITKAQFKVDYTAEEDAEVSGETEEQSDSETDTETESEEDETKTNETETAEQTDEEDDIETAADVLNTDDSEMVSTGAPVIRLTHKKVTVYVGDTFSFMNYVAGYTDDVDSEDKLSSRIHCDLDGSTYPSNITQTAGTYELKYYVIDTNGNTSNVETLILVVK